MKQKPTCRIDLEYPQQDTARQGETRQSTPVASLQSVKAECKDLYGSEAQTFYFYYAQLISAAREKALVFLNEAV
ncbi:MAG: hypothetical protein EOO14_19625 [Chitinophagaceae bacterium]|nr:MAG: hypothetical protein EOO14_19625 [Chitinophagaceae bacterium]